MSLQKKRQPCQAVIGFDGFLDDIVHVVDIRNNYNEYERINTIEQYASRIIQAAGLSTNIEYVSVRKKIGGNGPIMANALLQYDVDVYYIGSLGYPSIAPIFDDFTKKCTAYSISECAHTDAVEFNDGKLIISKTDAFNDVTYRNIVEKVGIDNLMDIYRNSQLIAFVNWTMLPFMTDIVTQFNDKILPYTQNGQIVFFDLADPQKRTNKDIRNLLSSIKQIDKGYRCVLGLNLKEARHIAGLLTSHSNGMTLKQLCHCIAEYMGIHSIVVHPADKAGAVVNGTYYEAKGPYCENPVLTTGAGDNFNAGFCYALTQGCSIEESLSMGVVTSGYYVRNAKSPTLDEAFLFFENL